LIYELGTFALLLAGFIGIPLSLLPADGQISSSIYDLIKIIFLVCGIGCFLTLGTGPMLRLMRKPLNQRLGRIVRAVGEGLVLAFAGCAAGLVASAGQDNEVLTFLVFGGFLLGVARAIYVMVMHLALVRKAGTKLAQIVGSIPVPQPNPPPNIPITTNVTHTYPNINIARDFVVYHGTPDTTNVRKIIREGLKPGNGNKFGTGVYMAESFDYAKAHSKQGGRVLELHIRGNTPYWVYENIPGSDANEKWANSGGGLFQPLIWIQSQRWFVCFGGKGTPVQIPGLWKVKVRDYFGNYVNA
jgi:hypothetical protein